MIKQIVKESIYVEDSKDNCYEQTYLSTFETSENSLENLNNLSKFREIERVNLGEHQAIESDNNTEYLSTDSDSRDIFSESTYSIASEDSISEEDMSYELDEIMEDNGSFGVNGQVLVYNVHFHSYNEKLVGSLSAQKNEEMCNLAKCNFGEWNLRSINDYDKDNQEMNLRFKVVKSVSIESPTSREYCLNESKWILKAKDPKLSGTILEMPVQFGKRAIIDFLSEFRNKKTKKLPKSLKGGRLPIGDDTCDLFNTDQYQQGLQVLAEEKLIWHITVSPNLLQSITKCVKKNPNNKFMIDHLRINQSTGIYDTWRPCINALADYPNVYLNLGGCEIWNVDPQPFLQFALGKIGYDRCCFGSNYYKTVIQGKENIRNLTEILMALNYLKANDEGKRQVFYKTALGIYG